MFRGEDHPAGSSLQPQPGRTKVAILVDSEHLTEGCLSTFSKVKFPISFLLVFLEVVIATAQEWRSEDIMQEFSPSYMAV